MLIRLFFFWPAFIIAFSCSSEAFAKNENCVKSLAALDKKPLTLFVVDGISSGAGYAPRARELFGNKIHIVHMKSSPHLGNGLMKSFGFNAVHYDEHIEADTRHFARLRRRLDFENQETTKFVAGAETSIDVHDLLTNYMGQTSNFPRYSYLRRDKEEMALAAALFVKVIPGKSFVDFRDARLWIQAQSFKYPLFVKPLKSSGSFGGTRVSSEAQLEAVFKRLIGQTDPLGTLISRLLVQPDVRTSTTVEYVMNVIVDKELGVIPTDIFRYQKVAHDDHVAYEASYLLRFNKHNLIHQKLLEAASGVVKGLKVNEGPLHIEFFEDQGEITFIEAGARPAGGGMPQFVRKCGGYDQITMQLMALFDRKRFKKMVAEEIPLESEGIMIDLRGPESPGVILSLARDKEIRARIPGLVNIDWHVHVGDRIGRAKDIFSSPGVVNIKGTPREFEEGYKIVRELEPSGLYRTRPLGWKSWLGSLVPGRSTKDAK